MRDEPRQPRSDLVSYSAEQDRSPQLRDRRQGMYPSTPASSLRNTKNEDLTPMFPVAMDPRSLSDATGLTL